MAKVPTVPALCVGDARTAVARFGRSPRTVGIPLLPPDASEQTWLDARRDKVTASEIAAVLGRSPYDSPFSLWWRKQPDWQGAGDLNSSMRIGQLLEPIIGQLWAESHPEAALYRPGAALWGHYEHQWLAATPDYFAVFSAPDGSKVWVEPVECKAYEGGEGWGHAGSDEMPFHIVCQAVVQCMVVGARYGHVIRLSGKRVTEYRVDIHDHAQLIEDLLHSGAAFHSSLYSGIVPDIDGHTATGEALQTLYSNVEKGVEASIPDELAEVFEEAYGQVKSWEVRLSEAKNRIRQIMGQNNAQFGVRASTGDRLVTRSHYKRNGYTVGPAEIDQIRKA